MQHAIARARAVHTCFCSLDIVANSSNGAEWAATHQVCGTPLPLCMPSAGLLVSWFGGYWLQPGIVIPSRPSSYVREPALISRASIHDIERAHRERVTKRNLLLLSAQLLHLQCVLHGSREKPCTPRSSAWVFTRWTSCCSIRGFSECF